MSVRENIKQFVPEFLHPVLRPVARRFADSDRPRVPHTTFPLDQGTRDAIASSLRLSESSTAKLADSASFPEIEELIRYWGIVRGITQVLGPYNPSDKYFDWSHFEDHRARGLLDITKDLFVAWLAINRQPKVILEIGCRTGKSIATHLFVHPEPSLCTAVLIDLFVEMGSPEKILSNLRCLGIPHTQRPSVGGLLRNRVPANYKHLFRPSFRLPAGGWIAPEGGRPERSANGGALCGERRICVVRRYRLIWSRRGLRINRCLECLETGT